MTNNSEPTVYNNIIEKINLKTVIKVSFSKVLLHNCASKNLKDFSTTAA